VHRDRSLRLLTSWVFVAALLLKSAVPMLASAAADLQGKALAEICDVYGVDMTSLDRGPGTAATHQGAHHRGTHDAHAGHGGGSGAASIDAAVHAQEPGEGNDTASSHRPTRVTHGGDHCVLSALAFALPADVAALTPSPQDTAPGLLRHGNTRVVSDPAARWAARLQHGPPVSS
jgi:hypothetical protein